MKDLFEQSKTIAVVGLSDVPKQVSYRISKLMQSYGFKIIHVNPTIDQFLRERAYYRLLIS
ncbi:CoA-binding protein [Amphibacillus sp. MSJ-3]|uniref:CoA-binding protein n=1 Tax=Amphibacillus sp. MSJ-3 TaxID=2841505 RepID=UPI001C0ECD5E|nr:CoA-binding protein [Amphibacillus sp. MSJ-3]